MIAQILVQLFVAITWMTLQNVWTISQFILGFVLGLIGSYIVSRKTRTDLYFFHVFAAVELLIVFLYELIKSTLRVSYIVLHPRLPASPGLIAIPLDVQSDIQVTVFAGLITLTPGTFSVDVADDRSTLYIHTLEMGDPEQIAADLKSTFESRVRKVFAS